MDNFLDLLRRYFIYAPSQQTVKRPANLGEYYKQLATSTANRNRVKQQMQRKTTANSQLKFPKGPK